MLKPVAWFDSPKVLDCSITPIPGNASLPLQVIASLSQTINLIHIIQSTTSYIGIHVGAIGQEELVCIIGGPSPSPIETLIGKNNRVSLRNLDTGTISSGSVCCQFLAYIRPPRF